MALPSHPSVKGGRPRRTAAFFLPPALAPQLKPNIHHHCRWFGSATVVKHLLCRAQDSSVKPEKVRVGGGLHGCCRPDVTTAADVVVALTTVPQHSA
uniref:Uncharacterized protein n=1 Tax=Triticum urartu TaxID=4572 RepID=A0A8R7Q275_TRIUA